MGRRARNGLEVEERLGRCSLYHPALDLAVETTDGSFAGYALFRADPVTRVALLVPMRAVFIAENARRAVTVYDGHGASYGGATSVEHVAELHRILESMAFE